MNRVILFLFFLLCLQISVIDGANGVLEQVSDNTNKVKIVVPPEWYPENGKPITVTVTLPPNTTSGDHISFELLSSAFPGYCNNRFFGDKYGEDDKDTENQDDKDDMAFIPANLDKPVGASWENSNSTEQMSSVKLIIDNNAETAIPTTVNVKIECYDYGAVSKLAVAVYNKEDETQNTAMIPVDTDGNYIADSWQKGVYSEVSGASKGWAKNGVQWQGSANDDTEDGPEDNNHNGDGLTAFAEYRGHFVRDVHIRTHPNEKDVFIHLESDVRTPIGTKFGWADNLPSIFKLRDVSKADVRNYAGADTSINFLVCSDYHRITQRAVKVIVDSIINNSDDHIGKTFPRGSAPIRGPSRVSRIVIYKSEIEESVTEAVTAGGINADEFTIRDNIWNWVLGHEIGHALSLTHVMHLGDPADKQVVLFSGEAPKDTDPIRTYTSDEVLHSIMYKDADINKETDITKDAFGKWVVKYDTYAEYHNPWYQLVPTNKINNYDNVVQASTPMPDFSNFPEQSTNNQLQTIETPMPSPGSSQNTQPDAPYDLRTTFGNGQVRLSWTAGGGTTTDYQYRYRESGGSWRDWISALLSNANVLSDTEVLIL